MNHIEGNAVSHGDAEESHSFRLLCSLLCTEMRVRMFQIDS